MTNALVPESVSQGRHLAQNIERMRGQFEAVLPPGVDPNKFMRVTLTAVQNNPALLEADRQTLYHACNRAAQDGLLPDGREGVFNIYKTKVNRGGRDEWVAAVQWLPMVAGRRKQFYKHKVVVDAQVVYQNDNFSYRLGDNAEIFHEPLLMGDRGEMQLAYAIATLPDGRKVREVMTRPDVMRAKASSKGGDNSPWAKHEPEMWRKTVLNRIAKILYGLEGFDDIAASIDREHKDAGVEGMFDEEPTQSAPPPASGPDRDTVASKVVKAKQLAALEPPVEQGAEPDKDFLAEYEAAEERKAIQGE